MNTSIVPTDIAVVSLDLLFSSDHLNSLSRRLPDANVREFSTVLEAVAHLTPGHPAVILVGPSPEPDPDLLGHVQQANLGKEVGIVFAMDEPDSDLGVSIRDTLGTAPLGSFDAAAIDAAVDVALLERQQADRRAPQGPSPEDFALTTGPRDELRLIVVTGAKGGAGRSTVAVNLAAALARREGTSVALVDAHKSTGDVGLLLGLERTELGDDADIDDFEIDAASVGRLLRTHEATGLQVFIPPANNSDLDTLSVEQVLRLLVAIESHVDFAVIDAPLALVAAAGLPSFSDAVLLVTTTRLASLKNTRIARDLLDGHDSLAVVMNTTAPTHEHAADESSVESFLRLRVLAELPWDDSINEGATTRPVHGLSKAKSGYTKRMDQLAEHLHEHSLVR